MKTENGNALFLILIAVALFAALSYAITQSGRGGSGIGKERAEILAAQLMQEIVRFQNGIARLKIIGGYDQVLFNDSAANTSGTCYSGDTTITPCHTIGLFNADEGINMPFWTEEWRDPSQSSTAVWIWQNRQILVNGTNLGSTDPDIALFLQFVPQTICEAVERRLSGTTTPATFTSLAGAGHGVTSFVHYKDNTFTNSTASNALDITSVGCYLNGGNYNLMFTLEEN